MKNLEEIIKIGKVSSVDVEKRTARVIFEDKEEMVSGELHVLINHPLIKIIKKDNGAIWDGTGSYNSAPRGLGMDSYKTELPDTIDLSKDITYLGETHGHELHMEVHPWLPYVGQWVLCVFLPIGAGDGFVVGGY